jgi:outer membrane protein OmpA-like peptidoglycan-associated protein
MARELLFATEAIRRAPLRSAALSVRHGLRRSVGQPLDGALRGRMEARLGEARRTVPTGSGRDYHALEAAADTAAGGGWGGSGPTSNFSSVRLHTDGHAASAARRLGASAFTIGEHVYADPTLAPAGPDEQQSLLAHELAHVVQQRQLGRTLVQPRLIATGSDADLNRFFAIAGPAMGEKLSRDAATNQVTVAGPLASKSVSPAFASVMHKIIDDPLRDAEAHFGADQPKVHVGKFPFPDDMSGETEQKIDLDDIEALQAGVPGSGVAALAHELTENYQAHLFPADVDPGASRMRAAHAWGIKAEGDVAQETVGPGRRVATVSIGSGSGTTIVDFENYYLIFDRTENPKTEGVTISKARKVSRERLAKKVIDKYEAGSNTMPATGQTDFDAVVAAAADPTSTIRVEGFGDAGGDPFLQSALSDFRATEIKNRLVAAGIVRERIYAAGLAQSRLVAPNATPSGQAQNRRVEIVVERPKP